MKISVIGAGNIGGTLGRKWSQAGHAVSFGVRDLADPKLEELRPAGSVESIAESIAGADLVLFAVPSAAVGELAGEHGAALAGKVVIDATNNPRGAEMNNLAVLREKAPGAQLVRAFCSVGWENFANPQLGGASIDLLYCGHAAARPVLDQLIRDVGMGPLYLGDIDLAGLVDNMTRIWFTLAYAQGRGRRIAFKLLHE